MTQAPVELWREARDQARADVLGDLDKLRRYETVQQRRDALDELEKLVRAGWRRDLDSRESMHEREVMQTRITELEAALRDAEQVGTERMERIRALADSVDELQTEVDAALTGQAKLRTTLAETQAALATMEKMRDEASGHAQNAAWLLEQGMEREERLFAEGLGLADELRARTTAFEETLMMLQTACDELDRSKAHAAHSDAKLDQVRSANAGLSQRLAVLSMLEVERTPSHPMLHAPGVIDTHTT